MARGLQSQFIALFVRRKRLSQREQEALEKNLHLARELGAEIQELEGDDIADEIARFATDHRVTQIILGQSQRSRWYELLHGSLIQDLLHRLPDIDIHVVADQPDKKD
jgi:two-component system sensor histidine kinase KdpD